MQEKTKAPEKTYYLVHIYFGKSDEDNTYVVYQYQKSRRLTANQAWQSIHQAQLPIFSSGKLSKQATVFTYFDIIQKLNLDEKTCDRYCTFGFIG